MGYNGTGQPLTEPLSNYDVCKILGENTLDIGSLCTSGSINKWSFHKPMPGDSPRELTLQEKYDLDGGYINLVKKETLNGAANYYNVDNLDWELADLTWYRLTDFIGYLNTAGSFSPKGSVVYPAGKESGYITLTWNADNQQHVLNFKTSLEQSHNNYGFIHLGVLIFGDLLRYYHIGLLKDNAGAMSVTIPLDSLLGSISGRYNLQLVPIIVDNGIRTSSTLSSLTSGKLYTNDMLKNNGIGANQHQYAPFWLLPLGGVPFSCIYKTLLYRIFENITLTFTWYEGGYNTSTGQATFTGESIVQNDNDFEIQISMKLVGNANYEEQGSSNSWVTIFETTGGTTGTVNNTTRNFVSLGAGKIYAMTQQGGQSVNKWFPESSNKFAMVRVETAVRVLLGDKWLTKAYDTSFSFDTLLTEQYIAKYNYVEQELIEQSV